MNTEKKRTHLLTSARRSSQIRRRAMAFKLERELILLLANARRQVTQSTKQSPSTWSSSITAQLLFTLLLFLKQFANKVVRSKKNSTLSFGKNKMGIVCCSPCSTLSKATSEIASTSSSAAIVNTVNTLHQPDFKLPTFDLIICENHDTCNYMTAFRV